MIPPTINLTLISGPTDMFKATSVRATHLAKRASETELNGIKCSLTDEFGLFIQGILAFVAFSTLLLKRCKEPVTERRTFRIWFYDTSKQAVGAVVIHFANVVLASQFSGDPCTWYFINFLLDSTIGLIIIWLLLRLTQFAVDMYGLESLRSGVYGTPPKCRPWAGQCLLYLLVVVFEKITVALLVQLEFWEDVRKFILKPITNAKMEVAIVMLIVPFVFNAVMFWVVDGFLMRKRRKSLDGPEDQLRVKYQRRQDIPKTASHSDEEAAVLLDNVNEDDGEDGLYHREIIR